MANSGNNDKSPEEYSEKDQWNDDLDLPPINHKIESSKKPILEKAEFDRKKKKRWIPIVIVITLIAISSPFILNTCNNDNDSSNQNLITKSTEIDDSTPIEENLLNESNAKDSAFIEDTAIIENIESEVEIELKEIETITENKKYYHIIIGSFERENYANAFVKELTQKTDATQIIKYDSLYRVSYNSYDDSDEAEIELDYIRNTLNLKSWIAYMR
jgi:hypothetical protein